MVTLPAKRRHWEVTDVERSEKGGTKIFAVNMVVLGYTVQQLIGAEIQVMDQG